MAKSQIYKSNQSTPLVLKAPHDKNAKLFYRLDYRSSTDSEGNPIDPYLPIDSNIIASTWTVTPDTVTLTASSFTSGTTTIKVTAVPSDITSFVLTNHITVAHASGDQEEDDRSINVSVVDR